MKLEIELVPSTAWFKNLRTLVGATIWNKIRRQCYQDAGHKCEICGGKGRKHPVECHEVWEFKDNRIILKGLISLCPPCHEVKHIGLASVRGRLPQATKHFMKVNQITLAEANRHIHAAFKLHTERSKHEWELDLDYLEHYLTGE